MAYKYTGGKTRKIKLSKTRITKGQKSHNS